VNTPPTIVVANMTVKLALVLNGWILQAESIMQSKLENGGTLGDDELAMVGGGAPYGRVTWFMSHTKFRYSVYLVVAMGAGVIFFTQHEGKTFLESLYWVVITGLAVGFGDLYPSDQPGQIFTFFYMLLLVPITYALISLMVRREQPVAEVLGRSLSLEMFEFFDRDGDGQVTKDEYLGTILVMLEKTDFETVRGSFCCGQEVQVACLVSYHARDSKSRTPRFQPYFHWETRLRAQLQQNVFRGFFNFQPALHRKLCSFVVLSFAVFHAASPSRPTLFFRR
jgi:hypothetical protein